jgi:uncharacterized protein
VTSEALQVGDRLEGTILSVVDFGAFVDVGLPDMGLVHISQLAGRFVYDPHDVAYVGQHVVVWVASIEPGSGRVSLTMIPPGSARRSERPPRRSKPVENTQRSGTPRQPARKNRSDRSKAPRRSSPSQERKPPRPKAPLVPITQAMVDGREPMRTFGDLLQFHQRRLNDELPETESVSDGLPPTADPPPQTNETTSGDP